MLGERTDSSCPAETFKHWFCFKAPIRAEQTEMRTPKNRRKNSRMKTPYFRGFATFTFKKSLDHFEGISTYVLPI